MHADASGVVADLDEWIDEHDDQWERGEVSVSRRPDNVELPQPATADEATALLANFMPGMNTPEALLRLLECRADPNVSMSGYDTYESPLECVLWWARDGDMGIMRDHLLRYGATNTKALESRWRRLPSIRANQQAWVAKKYYDPR